MLRSNKFWIIVLGGVVIVSIAATLALGRVSADTAHIYQNGALIESLDLSSVAAPYTFTVESALGANVIMVERGRIRISEADCPDMSCVRQGWVSGGTTPIVCLPHRLVIRPGGNGPVDVDAVTG
jgi:hypothetical protein